MSDTHRSRIRIRGALFDGTLSRPKIRLSAFVILLILYSARGALGGPPAPLPQPPPRSKPYCGLYSLYLFLLIHGARVEFEDLLKPEYVGSSRGSSLRELERAAQAHGIHSARLMGVSTRVLKRSPYPIMLHVHPTADEDRYAHYLLYLGTRGGQALTRGSAIQATPGAWEMGLTSARP
jgi:hypothetical protein